jgi:crossover junction endodeoxyribonuclease RuvC
MQAGYNRVILGIDPGTTVMGYGIIGIAGKRIDLLSMGALKLSNVEGHALKLKKIFEQTCSLISEYLPDELAIEAPFYGKNVQSMLKLGRAQGVAIAAALSHSIPVFEYEPRKVKQSVTGKGSASKEQVAAMLPRLLTIRDKPVTYDASDALAVALCHYFQKDEVSTGKKYSGWQKFIKENPDRVK